MVLEPTKGACGSRGVAGRSLKAKVASGEPVFGCLVSVGHPVLVEIVGHAGFDFVEIDFERGAIDLAQAEAMTIAARASGVAPIWRMQRLDHLQIGTALDLGAEGVLVPHVKTAAEARAVVSAALYPPAGDRGFAPRRAVRFGADDVGAYYHTANETTFVSVMIEDAEAVEAIDEIASVEGLDCLVIGTWDLSRSLGVALETRHAKVVEAIERVIDAAREHGVACSMVPESPADAGVWFARGATVFEAATVEGLLTAAAGERVAAMRGAVEGGRRKGRKKEEG